MKSEPATRHGGSKVAELLAVLPSTKTKKILILPHDNPDPDSLASAAALCTLIKHKTKRSPFIGLGGIIGRSENRALAATLDIPLVPVEQLFPDFTGAVILVDTQPRRANNSLPDHLTPVAVIDHHPDWGGNAAVPFVDLREPYGATSTIVTEYLEEGEVPPDSRIATALFYGISSETQYLGREATPADIIACQFLYPYVDKRLLGEIQYPSLRRDYFRLIGQAMHNTMLYDDTAVTILEEVPYPDAVAEVADLLLRLDEAQWAACFAFYRDFLYVSLRTQDPDATAGLLLASLLPSGMAGGHGMAAGGKIKTSRRLWKKAARLIGKALLQAWGKTTIRPQPLVDRNNRKRNDEEIQSLLLSLNV
ncbi:MAG: bifunctional oligoribonuclease/PAP phosphatase NrnA [Candidatus Binatia bacterium]